jgi:hypothetical protein
MYSKLICCVFIHLLLAYGIPVRAQHYQAVSGSSMAGSLGVSNNPASIVHVPFAWDLTLFSLQDQHTTNAFVIKNGSLLNFKNAEIASVNGNAKRVLLGNQDIHLLNARIRLDSRQAIAFGVNLRSAFSLRTSRVNWQDPIMQLYDFLDINRNHLPLSGEMRSSVWTEIFGSYARTLVDNGSAIINAGLTLSVNKSLGGGYLDADNLNYFPSAATGPRAYNLATGELRYGYSATVDDLDGNNGGIRELVKGSFTNISASLGLEYIIPSYEDEDPYSYTWKIGISAMDLGFNTYRYSRNSRFAVLNKQNVSDSLIEATFRDVGSIEEGVDSLARLAGSINAPGGNFNIIQPARLVINADKHLQGNFFVNGQLTIPLTSALSASYLTIRDMNLLALTPRYETRSLGVYMPVTFNTQKQLWVGGALRAGPLLLGIHNWSNLFAKNKLQRGGFYLALTFRPGKKKEEDSRSNRGNTDSKLSRKQRKYLDCPPL